MMKKNFTFMLLIFALCWALPAAAQNYKGAIGLRLGYPASVSGKLFLSESLGVEAFVGTRSYTYYRWVNAGAALLIHKPLEIDDFEGLSYYYGGGASAYFWSYKNSFIDDEPDMTFGLTGYIGLEYSFEDIPLNITMDWGPTFFINGALGGFGGRYGAVGVRYIFSRG